MVYFAVLGALFGRGRRLRGGPEGRVPGSGIGVGCIACREWSSLLQDCSHLEALVEPGYGQFFKLGSLFLVPNIVLHPYKIKDPKRDPDLGGRPYNLFKSYFKMPSKVGEELKDGNFFGRGCSI